MAQQSFDPVTDAIDRLRWLRDLQKIPVGQRGVQSFDMQGGPGDTALFDAIESATQNLARLQAAARQSGDTKTDEQIQAAIEQAGAQSEYQRAQAAATRQTTERIASGEMTPEQAAANQIASRNAATAERGVGVQEAQLGIAAQNANTSQYTAEAQAKLSQAKLDFDNKRAEIDEAYKNKTLDFEQAKTAIQQAENALNREIQWYQAETQRLTGLESNRLTERSQDLGAQASRTGAGLTQRGQDIQFEQQRQSNELTERNQDITRRATDIAGANTIADRTTTALEKARGYTVPKETADAFYGALQSIPFLQGMPNLSHKPLYDPRTVVANSAAQAREQLGGYQVPGPTTPMRRPNMRYDPQTGEFFPEES